MRLLKLYSTQRKLQQENEALKEEIRHLKIVPKHNNPKEAGLVFALRDLEDPPNEYFRCPPQMAIPIERYGKAQDIIMWMSAGMHASELRMLLNRLEKENEMALKGQGSSHMNVGVLIKEMKLRMEMVMHSELLYEFAAVHLIRGDEPVEIYSETIQQEKKAAFKKIVAQGGAYPFFQMPELNRSGEIMKLSEEEWMQFFNDSIRQQTRLKKIVQYMAKESSTGSGSANVTSNKT